MRYGYLLEEKLTYQREIILETELTEEELIHEMEEAEKRAETAEDVADALNKHGEINVIEYPDDDLRSPLDMEVEYLDHRKK